jgi:hypothetical protein
LLRFRHAIGRFAVLVIAMPANGHYQRFCIEGLGIRIVGITRRNLPHGADVSLRIGVIRAARRSGIQPGAIGFTDVLQA